MIASRTGRVRPVAWPAMPATELDQIVNLCKRRGFVYPSAEIYGGFRSTYDYGPLGVADAAQRQGRLGPGDGAGARRRRAHRRRRSSARRRCGRRAATSPTSPTRSSTARTASSRFRLDKLDDPDTCPNCGKHGTFTEARQFNLMFKTQAGPVEDAGAVAYLRPETAQGMFVNFANVLQTTRKKPPFGIAQVGKAFRNEITPQNWIFRTREFEQMEMEFFVPPADGPRWYEYWCNERLDWYVRHGIPRRPAAPAAARRRRAVALLGGHVRRRVPVPVGLRRARGHRPAHRLRPDASTPSTRASGSTTSTRRPTSATCRT